VTSHLAMAQTVNRRPFTAEDGVRSHVSPCEICSDQNDPGTGFSPNTSIFPPMLHTHLHLRLAITRRTNGRSLGNFQKECSSGNQGASSKSSSDAIYSYEGIKTADQSRAIISPWFVYQQLCFSSRPLGTHPVLLTSALLFLPFVVSPVLSDNRRARLVVWRCCCLHTAQTHSTIFPALLGHFGPPLCILLYLMFTLNCLLYSEAQPVLERSYSWPTSSLKLSLQGCW